MTAEGSVVRLLKWLRGAESLRGGHARRRHLVCFTVFRFTVQLRWRSRDR